MTPGSFFPPIKLYYHWKCIQGAGHSLAFPSGTVKRRHIMFRSHRQRTSFKRWSSPRKLGHLQCLFGNWITLGFRRGNEAQTPPGHLERLFHPGHISRGGVPDVVSGFFGGNIDVHDRTQIPFPGTSDPNHKMWHIS